MKKLSVMIVLWAVTFVCFSQVVISSVEIGGRALKGDQAYSKSFPLTNIGNGDWVYYGYFYNTNPIATGNGFKFVINYHITASTQWGRTGFVAPVAQTPILPGYNYACNYVASTQTNDRKWILDAAASDGTNPAGEGWYKLTLHTADMENVSFDFEAISGELIDVLVRVPGGVLSPAFDPNVEEYECILENGSYKVKPEVFGFANMTIGGSTSAVDVSAGSGQSIFSVTSLDGTITKNYTINYSVSVPTIIQNAIDLTDKIINNNFDFVSKDVPFTTTETEALATYPEYPGLQSVSSFISGAWRPVKSNTTKIENHLEFYGWKFSAWDWLWKNSAGLFLNADETTKNQSIGINAGDVCSNGSAAWIAGDPASMMPDDFEFYQTIDASELGEGTYLLEGLLVVDPGAEKHTSQRLFANNSVQFYGEEYAYLGNKTPGEIYSYAGYTPEVDIHKPMKVYVTISEGENLKLGVRSGNKDRFGNNATASGNMKGWFKMDYFRLFKLNASDAANANLASLTLSSGTLDFNPEIQIYNVEVPGNIQQIIPSAIPEMKDAKIEGDEVVDLSSGSGVSTIKITALDGITTNTYTINYTKILTSSQFLSTNANYKIVDRKLSVTGVDAYSVFNINGVKIAEINDNTPSTSVGLQIGVYVVKAKNAQPLKVIVR